MDIIAMIKPAGERQIVLMCRDNKGLIAVREVDGNGLVVKILDKTQSTKEKGW